MVTACTLPAQEAGLTFRLLVKKARSGVRQVGSKSDSATALPLTWASYLTSVSLSCK